MASEFKVRVRQNQIECIAQLLPKAYLTCAIAISVVVDLIEIMVAYPDWTPSAKATGMLVTDPQHL